MEANTMFWEIGIEVYTEAEDGKIKKNQEVHLVDAATMAEAEAKVSKEMDGLMSEFKIKNAKISKICSVY